MSFKKAISLIILILAFSLSSNAIGLEKSKPINYYIEHDGEQKKKPKYTEGAFEKDALSEETSEEESKSPKKKVKKKKLSQNKTSSTS